MRRRKYFRQIAWASTGLASQPTRRASRPQKVHHGGTKSVDRIKLKALLRRDALTRLVAGAYGFCPTATFEVVLFRPSSIFRRQHFVVPVYQKPAGERTVC